LLSKEMRRSKIDAQCVCMAYNFVAVVPDVGPG